MNKNIIFDLSNIVWACYHKIPKNGYTTGILLHNSLLKIRSVINKYNPVGIAMACDSQNTWRKQMYDGYKGKRDRDDPNYKEVVLAIAEFVKFFDECTNIPVLKVPHMEADDIIYVMTNRFRNNINIIASSDTDFVQLIDGNTILYSHTQKIERITEDAQYDLFVKCIRGDVSDNIFSAYPRVREKLLRKSWDDRTEMINLMETIKVDGRKVGDDYNFNKSLIDLKLIPTEHQNAIYDSVINTLSKTKGKYNTLKTMRFLGEHGLKNIAKQLNSMKRIFLMTYQQ